MIGHGRFYIYKTDSFAQLDHFGVEIDNLAKSGRSHNRNLYVMSDRLLIAIEHTQQAAVSTHIAQ